jgi:hypothetical protein
MAPEEYDCAGAPILFGLMAASPLAPPPLKSPENPPPIEAEPPIMLEALPVATERSIESPAACSEKAKHVQRNDMKISFFIHRQPR